MDKKQYDFSGWVTRNNVLCTDGRTILKDAFKHNDNKVVPLVWNHNHVDIDNVLGKVLLENRNEGVYGYGTFNSTEEGQRAKELISHGDITSLSIYANQLKERNGHVAHGDIKEVSLVLAGANIGAYIDNVSMAHSEDGTISEAIIYCGEDEPLLMHSEEGSLEHADEVKKEEIKSMEESETKSVEDVFNTLTDEQKQVVYYMLGSVINNQNGTDDEEEKEGDEKEMKHNIFENEEENNIHTLSHSDLHDIIVDGKKYGSLKESFLAHTQDYGIENIDFLFPEATEVNKTPDFISRDMGWVQKVMSKVKHLPFSRIKSTHADITEDEARAKGYIKGNLKKEEVFGLLKRTTTPTTVYKKQKLDRDDVIDITDFDVVAWLKAEMRMMLDEELARAFLVGDGRSVSSDDKINEQNIRPIWKDSDLYNVKCEITVKSSDDESERAKKFIRGIIKSRKQYKGSGNPTLYTTEDILADCLLIEDTTGRIIYDSVEKLKNALRVADIVAVPVMENLTRSYTPAGSSTSKTVKLMGILVNLNDYNVGADKGGAVNMFDDFDIDYNQQKYLIETRCSAALTKPFSAISYEMFETTGA